MVAQLLDRQSLQFPIQVKGITDDETKEYYRKKLYELSIRSLGEIPQLEEPSDEQLKWLNRRMLAPAKSWEVYRQ